MKNIIILEDTGIFSDVFNSRIQNKSNTVEAPTKGIVYTIVLYKNFGDNL